MNFQHSIIYENIVHFFVVFFSTLRLFKLRLFSKMLLLVFRFNWILFSVFFLNSIFILFNFTQSTYTEYLRLILYRLIVVRERIRAKYMMKFVSLIEYVNFMDTISQKRTIESTMAIRWYSFNDLMNDFICFNKRRCSCTKAHFYELKAKLFKILWNR